MSGRCFDFRGFGIEFRYSFWRVCRLQGLVAFLEFEGFGVCDSRLELLWSLGIVAVFGLGRLLNSECRGFWLWKRFVCLGYAEARR